MSTGSGEPPVRRRRGRPGYDQETILRTAVELFNRKGYDATSMGDLAKELGLTKPAIYHHVTSKEQLLSLALDDALDELTALVTEASDERTGTAPTSVCATWCGAASRSWWRTSRPSRSCCGCAATARSSRRPWSGAAGWTTVSPRSSRTRSKEGALRDDVPPALVSRLLFGMVNSLVEWYRADGAYDTATVARRGHDDGLRRARPPRAPGAVVVGRAPSSRSGAVTPLRRRSRR